MQTKIKIYEAATDLFFEKGFYGVTYSQIGERVGLSHAAIYRHFLDMDDLILQACRFWTEQAQHLINREISELDSAEAQLGSYLKVNLDYAAKNREKDALLLGVYHYSMRSQPMLDFYEQLRSSAILKIQSYILRGARERLWSPENPKDCASSIHGLLVGEIIKLIIQPKEESLGHRHKRIFSASLRILT